MKAIRSSAIVYSAHSLLWIFVDTGGFENPHVVAEAADVGTCGGAGIVRPREGMTPF